MYLILSPSTGQPVTPQSFLFFIFIFMNIFINFLTNIQFTYANKNKVEEKKKNK